MNVIHFNKLIPGFSTILLFVLNTHAALELVISPYRQWGSNTCWAACSYMVLNAYQCSNIGSDEMQIRRWAFPPDGPDVTNQLFGTSVSVDAILINYGTIFSNPTPFNPSTGGGNISEGDITDEIDGNRPVFCGRLISDGSPTGRKHMLLIIGYTGSGGSDVNEVVYIDPANGQRLVDTYAQFVRLGNDYQWIESLRLITGPHYPIPTGPDDYVRIRDGGTTTVTPSTRSLSYEAGYHYAGLPPSYPVSWNWKLIFVHSGGNCIAKSWTSTSSASELTWNISNFYLPTGYQWIYNYQGKIPGRVELDLLDSDGCHHLDAINVIYVPSSLYPGYVVYEGHTVSGTQPQVKAHQVIITQNDQFLSGSSITFRSGERIDIKDGITIRNGSTTNFTIDPSIR